MNEDSKTVTFKFALGQEVTIKALKLKGEIYARSERPGDLREYRVIWWADSKRHDEWLYESELA